MKNPDPHGRQGQKKQGRENKVIARLLEKFVSRNNVRGGKKHPKNISLAKVIKKFYYYGGYIGDWMKTIRNVD